MRGSLTAFKNELNNKGFTNSLDNVLKNTAGNPSGPAALEAPNELEVSNMSLRDTLSTVTFNEGSGYEE